MSAIVQHRPRLSMPAVQAGASAPVRDETLDSRRLLQGRNEVLIRHGGETYRLRYTRNDKLILTK